jgi:hypothetical protein
LDLSPLSLWPKAISQNSTETSHRRQRGARQRGRPTPRSLPGASRTRASPRFSSLLTPAQGRHHGPTRMTPALTFPLARTTAHPRRLPSSCL